METAVLINNSASSLPKEQERLQEQEDVLSMAPDLVMIVGKKAQQFEENSFLLRTCSEYFRNVIAPDDSGMLVLEFPDQSAEGWAIVRTILQPFGDDRVTMENLKLVLPWFSLLEMVKGLDDCDEVLAGSLSQQTLPVFDPTNQDWLTPLRNYLHVILDGLETATHYHLRTSKESFLVTLAPVVNNHPMLFAKKECQALGAILREDEECRQVLWPILCNRYLPELVDLDVEQARAVIRNAKYFDSELQAGMARQEKLKSMNGLERKAWLWKQKRARNREQKEFEKQKQKWEESEQCKLARKQKADERLLSKAESAVAVLQEVKANRVPLDHETLLVG